MKDEEGGKGLTDLFDVIEDKVFACEGFCLKKEK